VAVRQRQVQAAVVQHGVAAPHVDAEVQGVVGRGEDDDHRELDAEQAVHGRRDPPPAARTPGRHGTLS
jgi:hypothetical protein